MEKIAMQYLNSYGNLSEDWQLLLQLTISNYKLQKKIQFEDSCHSKQVEIYVLINQVFINVWFSMFLSFIDHYER